MKMTRHHGLVFAAACTLLACDAGNASQEQQQAAPGPDQTALKSKEVLTVEAGNISLQLKASACQQVTTGLVDCHRDVDLVVSTADGKIQHVLNPESVIVADEALIYRGAITEANKPDTHTFVLSDVNADGRDDLMIWSGREGAYGGPSFDVYLFDPGALGFVFSQSFSDLTVGYVGLFTVENGRITTRSVSGCCVHIRETYVVESNAPKLIERVTEDSTQGNDSVQIKTERLVAGELREVAPN